MNSHEDRRNEDDLHTAPKPTNPLDTAGAPLGDDVDRSSGAPGSKDTVKDPENLATKPYGTTKDQVSTMEGEGQALTPGQEPPAEQEEG